MSQQSVRSDLYNSMVVHPWAAIASKALADKIILNQARYEGCARMFSNPGLKWWLIAVIHNMEAELDFKRYLGNGQLLSEVTTIAPVGRGPFATFEDGVLDALNLENANDITDWSIGNVLYFLEGYNGYGYELYHKMNSPYLWSGSDKYVSGKYTNDGHFDASAISNQVGVALLLKQLGVS